MGSDLKNNRHKRHSHLSPIAHALKIQRHPKQNHDRLGSSIASILQTVVRASEAVVDEEARLAEADDLIRRYRDPQRRQGLAYVVCVVAEEDEQRHDP